MRFNENISENTESTSVPPKATTEDFEKLINKYDSMVKEFHAHKEALKKEFETTFSQFSKGFFQLVPQIKSVSWTQYTPYFDDGDTCEFSINSLSFANFIPEEPTPYLSDADVAEQASGEWACSNWELKESLELTLEQKVFCTKFEELIMDNSEFMQDLFDDHVVIQLTADSIQIEEYDHD